MGIENLIAVSIMNVFALFLVMYMTLHNEMLHRHRRNLLVIIIIATMTVTLAECASSLFDMLGKSYIIPNILTNILIYCLSPIIPIIMSVAFDNEYHKRISWLYIVATVNAVIVISSPFTGLVFTITPENEYIRGSFYFVCIIAYAIGMIEMFRIILKSLFSNYYMKKTLLLLLFAFVFSGTAIQLIYPQIHTLWLCVTFALSIYYSFLCENNNKQDNLTTLYNRRVYDNIIMRYEQDAVGIVVIFDVDDFKLINDKNGHSFGDYSLNKVGTAIRAAFDGLGYGYRTGGDEFCVICENAAQAQVDAAISEFIKLIEAVRKRHSLLPTVSYGYCEFGGKYGGIESALLVADSNMYKYKNKSKD